MEAGLRHLDDKLSTMSLGEEPKTSLATLPTELQLKILSDLPARQIQRCRAINRRFRGVIDLEANNSLCSGPTTAKSLARLQSFITEHCEFPTTNLDTDGNDSALLDVALDYYHVYGIPSPDDTSSDKSWRRIYGLVFMFVALKGRHQDFAAMQMNASVLAECQHLAEALSCISWLHKYRLSKNPSWRRQKCERLEICLGPAQAEYVISRVESGMFRDVERSRPDGKPVHLSGMITYPLDEDMVSMLNLPVIPLITTFNYVSMCRWAVDVMRKAMQEGEPLGHLQRAAILEHTEII